MLAEAALSAARRARTGGDCYPVAAKLVMYGGLGPDARLVHGTPRLRVPPWTPYGHAWVEVVDEVIDRANNCDVRMDRDLYYAIGNIEEASVRRYTAEEAAANALRTRHWGPWE